MILFLRVKLLMILVILMRRLISEKNVVVVFSVAGGGAEVGKGGSVNCILCFLVFFLSKLCCFSVYWC